MTSILFSKGRTVNYFCSSVHKLCPTVHKLWFRSYFFNMIAIIHVKWMVVNKVKKNKHIDSSCQSNSGIFLAIGEEEISCTAATEEDLQL